MSDKEAPRYNTEGDLLHSPDWTRSVKYTVNANFIDAIVNAVSALPVSIHSESPIMIIPVHINNLF